MTTDMSLTAGSSDRLRLDDSQATRQARLRPVEAIEEPAMSPSAGLAWGTADSSSRAAPSSAVPGQPLPSVDELDSIVGILTARFPGYPGAHVRYVVYETHRRLAAAARIPTHLIPLTLNRARSELQLRPPCAPTAVAPPIATATPCSAPPQLNVDNTRYGCRHIGQTPGELVADIPPPASTEQTGYWL